MARIGPSEGTLPERTVQAWIRSMGLRISKNDRRLPGSPDVVVSSLKVAVFVDGRHWHDPEDVFRRMKDHPNGLFWIRKAVLNAERDRRQSRELVRMGWKVIRIWDSSLKDPRTVDLLAYHLTFTDAATVRL